MKRTRVFATISCGIMLLSQIGAFADLCPTPGTLGNCPPPDTHPDGNTACHATSEIGDPVNTFQQWCADCDHNEVKHLISQWETKQMWLVGCLQYDPDSQTWSTSYSPVSCEQVITTIGGVC